MKYKILGIIIALFVLFTVDALASGSDYLSAYTSGGGGGTKESSEMKKYFILLMLGIISAIFAFMPMFYLIFSTIGAMSNAPMNEYFSRVVQGEPWKFFFMAFIVLIVSYVIYIFAIRVFEITFLKDYAPLIGSTGFTREFWTLVPPEKIAGRHGGITLQIMNAIVTARLVIELISYIAYVLILIASIFFVYTYVDGFDFLKGKGGAIVFGSFSTLIVFASVSILYDAIASPILNSGESVVSIAKTFIKEGVLKSSGFGG